MMVDLVLPVAQHLRSRGIPVPTTKIVDATRALHLADATGLDHRQIMMTTLVSTAEHQRALRSVVDLFDADAGAQPRTEHPYAGLDDETLHATTLDHLMHGDRTGLADAAHALVDRHTAIRAGQPVGGTLHALRAYRGAEPDRLRRALLEAGPDDADDGLAPLRRRLWIIEVDRRMEQLRQAVEHDVRRRLVHDRGALSVARAVTTSSAHESDFLTSDVRALDAAVDSLQARLVHRLSRTAVAPPPGRLDVRRTARLSLSTGGAPVRLVHRPRQAPRPELVVLADISGSVATFARFTLTLAHVIQSRFRSVRSFVFVDRTDEVTDLLGDSPDILSAAQRIDEQGRGVELDGHSDYGRSFETFTTHWERDLSPRSIVLVLGDGRANHRDPGVAALRRIADRAGRVYWLNPERRASWDDGDSAMGQLAPICDAAVECRNVRQLGEFVETHL